MNIKLVTIDSERKSAERLGFETFTNLHDTYENLNKDLWIRWGFSSKFYDKNGRKRDFDFVINPADAIYHNCLKNKSIQTIGKVVQTPKLFQEGERIPKGIDVVYRTTAHAKGSDFRIIKGGNYTVEYGFYAKEFIKTNKEYRVFFCGDEVMSCTRYKHRDDLSDVCRSMYGYDFCKTPEKLKEITLKAKKALNLDVGCADILCEGKDNYYVLEFNTATDADSRFIVQFYQKSLNRLIKQKFGHLF